MTDELTRFRADVPPADPVAMMNARAALVREATGGHRARVWWQVGVTGVAVAAAAAALFALPSAASKTEPGSGLVHNPDGSLTIEFRELDDVLSVNMELYDAGVRAVILDSAFGGVVECWTKYEVTPSRLPDAPEDVVQPRPNPWADELTFWPDRIPDDMWLYIQAMVESPGNEEVQLRCDPNQQWELSRNWVGDTTPGYPNLPPFPETSQPSLESPTDVAPSGSVPSGIEPTRPTDHPSGPAVSPTVATR